MFSASFPSCCSLNGQPTAVKVPLGQFATCVPLAILRRPSARELVAMECHVCCEVVTVTASDSEKGRFMR